MKANSWPRDCQPSWAYSQGPNKSDSRPVTHSRWSSESYLNRAPKHIRGLGVIQTNERNAFLNIGPRLGCLVFDGSPNLRKAERQK